MKVFALIVTTAAMATTGRINFECTSKGCTRYKHTSYAKFAYEILKRRKSCRNTWNTMPIQSPWNVASV
uniref:Putative secreted peptide n=1 Tax=Anopheles braziliensis TaxID=58242 RepID=A0A2M3ZXD5_9DIPT